MIDKELSKNATFEDGILLKSIHPLGIKLLSYVGDKWRLNKIPLLGTIISDQNFISEVLLDKESFAEDNNVSNNFWVSLAKEQIPDFIEDENSNPQRILSSHIPKEKIALITETVISSILDEAVTKIEEGQPVNMVEVMEKISYLSMWHVVGLSPEKLKEIDTELAMRTLRSVTKESNLAIKKASSKINDSNHAKLNFLQELIREAYNNPERESIPRFLKDEGYSEETATSITTSLFLSGMHKAVSYGPRIIALLLKTGYLNYVTENRDTLTTGIREAMRVITPSPVLLFKTVRDIDFHGVSLKKDANVVLSVFGASKRLGDFDPFKQSNEYLQQLWDDTAGSKQFSTIFGLVQAEVIGKFLAKINSTNALSVISQESDDRGNSGRYKKLLIGHTLD